MTHRSNHFSPSWLNGMFVIAVLAGTGAPAPAASRGAEETYSGTLRPALPQEGSDSPQTVLSTKQSAAELETITVTATRGQTSPDRRSYDVDSPDSGTLEAEDAVARLPGALVDINGRLSILGQTQIVYMIDGQFAPDDLARHLPASLIARVEVVANPGAASGTTGSVVVNLILKSEKQRLARSLIARGQFGTRREREAALNFQAKNDKSEIIAGLTWSEGQRRSAATSEETFLDRQTGWPLGTRSRQTRSLRHDTSWNGNLLVTHDLAPDQELVLLCMANAETNRSTDQFERQSTVAATESKISLSAIRQFNLTTASCSPNYVFAKRGDSHFQLGLSFGATSRRTVLDQDISKRSSSFVFSAKDQGQAEHGGISFKRVRQYDQRRKLEYGVEYEQAGRRRDQVHGPFPTALSGQVSGRFRLHKEEVSAYLSYQFALGRFGLQPGLRLTSLSVKNRAMVGLPSGQSQRRTSLPSLHVDFRPGGNTVLRGSYSRKLLPISEDYFNPFPAASSFDTVTIGNPALEIGTETNFELSAERSGGGTSSQLRLYGRNRTKSIVPTVRYVSGDLLELRFIDGETDKRIGLNASYKKAISPRLEITVDLDMFRQEQAWEDDARRELRNTAWTAKWNATWSIDRNDSLLVSGQYADKVASFGSIRSEGLASSLKYTHSFPQNLSLAIEFLDFLASDVVLNRYAGPNLIQQTETRMERKSMRATLSKRF